jgi:outer membrane protein assembly factor BamA
MPTASWVALLAVVCAVPCESAAQETRRETLERLRAEKASQVRPYELSKAEKTLLYIEEKNPLRLIAPYNGFYIQYGYTAKPVGSGIAFGGGWRHDLFDRNARLVFEVGQSFRGYRMGRVDFSLPYLFDDRFEVGVEASYQRNPQEDFYGLGFSSQRGNRVNFSYETPEVQGRAMVKPAEWLNAGVRIGKQTSVEIEPGTDTRFPSIEELFSPFDAPGLTETPDYTYTDVFATLDTRDQPGNARSGSYVGLQWRRYDDSDFNRYSFDAFTLDAHQFLPIFDKKRVFAVRFQLQTTTAGSDDEVPFYMRPTLGGSDSLRSYSDFRFRDRNMAVLNVEYRWEAFSGMDMALFSDFGSVAPRLAELEFAEVRGAYGIGMRFNTYKAVFLRLDVAAGGSEGLRTFLKFSKAF